VLVHCERGDVERGRSLVDWGSELLLSENPQVRGGYAATVARVLRAEGRYAAALDAAEQALGTLGELSISDMNVKSGWVEAVEAALALPDLNRARELLAIPASLDPGELTPFLQANSARLAARLDAKRGAGEGVAERFRAAAALYREFGIVFHLAVTHLEHGEWLTAQGRAEEAQPLLTEAHETFERLQATPWLERSADLVLLQH